MNHAIIFSILIGNYTFTTSQKSLVVLNANQQEMQLTPEDKLYNGYSKLAEKLDDLSLEATILIVHKFHESDQLNSWDQDHDCLLPHQDLNLVDAIYENPEPDITEILNLIKVRCDCVPILLMSVFLSGFSAESPALFQNGDIYRAISCNDNYLITPQIKSLKRYNNTSLYCVARHNQYKNVFKLAPLTPGLHSASRSPIYSSHPVPVKNYILRRMMRLAKRPL